MGDTDETKGEEISAEWSNPHLQCVYDDIQARDVWAARDQATQRRRLSDRPRKRVRPYPGAPNFVVPIVDDTVREKTDQEITMMLNAPVFGYFIPLDDSVAPPDKMAMQRAFDTYLRYVINIPPKLEEALDAKNSRGFTIIKIVRNEYEQFRMLRPELGPDEPVMLPDIEVRDPADTIVPSTTKDIARSERICDIYRYPVREFKALGRRRQWKNVEEVADHAGDAEDNQHAKGLLATTGHLIGVTTGGKTSKQVLVYEYYHYANDWTVSKAKELYGSERGRREILKDRKCRMVFSPDAPDTILGIYAWREEDQLVPSPNPNEYRTQHGADRPWPHIQPRNENRSQYFYDSRGLNQLIMDDQIAASQARNTKHIIMDYFGMPQWRGANAHRNSPQMSSEPGSIIPDGVERVDPIEPPQSLDFTVDQFKREAGRRAGTAGMYEYSSQVSQSRKIQKTATESMLEHTRGDRVSSASADRFSNPWGEVFLQLWLDAGRMKLALPMVLNRRYGGRLAPGLYGAPVLIVPAANAKTLNPDLQFDRDKALWSVCKDLLAPMGAVFDVQLVAESIIAHADPSKLDWLVDPDKRGPGGQQPVYAALGEISQALKQMQQDMAVIAQMSTAAAKLAQENAGRLDEIGGAVARQ